MSRIVLNKTSFFSSLSQHLELSSTTMTKGVDSDCAGALCLPRGQSNGDVAAWSANLERKAIGSSGQACPVAPITAAFNRCLNREPSSSNETDVRVGDSDCVISAGALSDWVRTCVFCVEDSRGGRDRVRSRSGRLRIRAL